MIFFDLCLVAISFLLGYLFRDRIQDLYPLSTYVGLLPVLLVIWGGLLYSFGMYRSLRVRRAHELLFIVLKATLFSFIIFANYIYLFKLQDISRAFIISIFTFSVLLISFEKAVLVIFFRHIRKKDYNYRKILIIGTGKRAQYFIDLVHKHEEWGLSVIGLVDEDIAEIGKVIGGHKVLGSFKDIPDIVHNNIVDEVVFVVPRSWLNRIEEIMHFCEAEGLKVSVAVDYFDLKLSKAKQTDLDGFPLLTFESTPDKLWHLLIKRLFDIVTSGVALLILTPIFALVAIMIKATSKDMVFFRQKRCSLNGRTFTLYKFRTMV
ncbi:MAG: sugar transferase, partial [Candidatus Omnitrophota bacterium]